MSNAQSKLLSNDEIATNHEAVFVSTFVKAVSIINMCVLRIMLSLLIYRVILTNVSCRPY